MTSPDLIDEETDPTFLRRKAQEYGHSMSGWEENPHIAGHLDPPRYDRRCACIDCGAEILYEEEGRIYRPHKFYRNMDVFVGYSDEPAVSGTAHTTPCATYHLHYSTMFPFLPRPRRGILNKTKKGHRNEP